MFALRTKTVIKPMFENELETLPWVTLGHRFANDCCQEGEHFVGHNVGANLMFALEQMSPANECSRANTRFAPTMWSRQRSHLAKTMIKVKFSVFILNKGDKHEFRKNT